MLTRRITQLLYPAHLSMAAQLFAIECSSRYYEESNSHDCSYGNADVFCDGF